LGKSKWTSKGGCLSSRLSNFCIFENSRIIQRLCIILKLRRGKENMMKKFMQKRWLIPLTHISA
jgi:hypothetical protein